MLLSIGYSACHWCHVMEHESFEDAETAKVMNERFVSIKVDREERPDLDAVYMDAVVALTGSGGWPMTVFLTPDGHEPFLGGTYFPPVPRHGLPAFRDLLVGVSDAYHERREDVVSQAGELVAAIRGGSEARPSGEPLEEALLHEAMGGIRASFDGRWGGFGGAPKFPPASTLEFLLRRGETAMVERTLDAMAEGGMYDLVGGGFHRYSVDARWLVPHFEKMLYDNALLVPAYLHGWLVLGKERYRAVVEETVGYLLRELALPEGGFASAQDADTDGVEGSTYTWTVEEGVPAELLQPFEHGRSVLRGTLDPALWARLTAERSQRPQLRARRQGDRVVERPDAGRELAEAGRLRLRAGLHWIGRRRGGSASSCSARCRRPRAGCAGRGATAARRARAISTTTRTSRTASTSCTSPPASCAGSRSRGASPGSPWSCSATR